MIIILPESERHISDSKCNTNCVWGCWWVCCVGVVHALYFSLSATLSLSNLPLLHKPTPRRLLIAIFLQFCAFSFLIQHAGCKPFCEDFFSPFAASGTIETDTLAEAGEGGGQLASWPANGRQVTDTPLRDKTLPPPFCCTSVFMFCFCFFWNERVTSREASNYVKEVAVRRSNNPFLMCVQNSPFGFLFFCHFNSLHPLSQSASKPSMSALGQVILSLFCDSSHF